jgi:hypothetical protein
MDMTRAEAAAYLTTKGRPCKVSTLAKYAQGTAGPPFEKGERNRVQYKQADLDEWLAKPPAPHGRVNKRKYRRKANGAQAPAAHPLLAAVEAFADISMRAITGEGSVIDGIHYSQSLEALRALAREFTSTRQRTPVRSTPGGSAGGTG